MSAGASKVTEEIQLRLEYQLQTRVTIAQSPRRLKKILWIKKWLKVRENISLLAALSKRCQPEAVLVKPVIGRRVGVVRRS